MPVCVCVFVLCMCACVACCCPCCRLAVRAVAAEQASVGELEEEPAVDGGVDHLTGGGPGPAGGHPRGHVRTLPTRRTEVQEQGTSPANQKPHPTTHSLVVHRCQTRGPGAKCGVYVDLFLLLFSCIKSGY